MEGVVVRVYRFFTVSIYWASCGVLFKGSGSIRVLLNVSGSFSSRRALFCGCTT